MRRPVVAGNWKMNLDLASARALVAELRAALPARPTVDIAVCPPFVYLFPMAKAVADSPIRLGAQNCWHEPKGAFTGEVSPAMVKETGCSYVILGHSERRHTIGPRDASGRVQGETDEMVAAKCKAALAVGLTPIVCVGETLDQRDKGETQAVLSRQIGRSLASMAAEQVREIIVAYEPVWAIGTGRNATPGQAQEAHHHIRRELEKRYGPAAAEATRIQYGGSVRPDNVAALMEGPDVDGVLVGGASLKAAEFLPIIFGCIRAKGLA